MTSSIKNLNDLMFIFDDSGDDDLMLEIRDQVADLNTKIQEIKVQDSKTKFITPIKQKESGMSFDSHQLFQNSALQNTPLGYEFQSSKIKSVTYKKPNLIEIALQSKQESSIDTLILEITEQVKSIGLMDRQSITITKDKINSLKKIVTQMVENYFQNLNNQLEHIYSSPGLQHFKDKTLMELIKLRRTMDQEEQQTATRSRLWALKNLIKQKENDVPKNIFTNINIDSLPCLQETLVKLISIQVKGIQYFIFDEDQMGFLPQNMNINQKQKLLVRSQTDIYTSEEIFVYSPGTTCFFQFNIKNQGSFKKIPWRQQEIENIVLPNVCHLLYLQEQKKLVLLCNALLDDSQLYKPMNSVLSFDLVTQKFSNLSVVPGFINKPQVSHKSNYIYLWGGIVMINQDRLFAKRGYRYDISQDQWSVLPSMQSPRAFGQTCCMNNKIYLIGGMQNKFISNKLIEIFNLKSNQFDSHLQFLNELSYIPPLNGFTQQISQKQILLFGGTSSNEQSPINTQIFDVDQGSFQQGEYKFNSNQEGLITLPIVHNSKIYALNQIGEYLYLNEINQRGHITKYFNSISNL